MKIVYLIGNGFDLAQGLKTRYSEFYKSKISSVNGEGEIIEKLKKSISEDKETWADMEMGLGDFTNEMGGIEDLDYVCDFFKKNLREYLATEQAKVNIGSLQAVSNRDLLLKPYVVLPPEPNDSIEDFCSRMINAQKHIEVNIISFNYTNVVERAFGYEDKEILLTESNSEIQAKIQHIYKVHGSLDEMVMGVAEESQIANKIFINDVDAAELLLKPKFIEARRDFVWKKCYDAIMSANIIVLYGLSIGETDKNWWKRVADRVYTDSGVRVIIFGHSDNPNLDFLHRRREERTLYRKLMTLGGRWKTGDYSLFDNRIFVCIDDSLFSNIMALD